MARVGLQRHRDKKSSLIICLVCMVVPQLIWFIYSAYLFNFIRLVINISLICLFSQLFCLM